MTLPQEDRAELAHFLLCTLEPEDDDVEVAWAEEVARRVEEIRSGRALGRPLDEFMAELRERYP